MGSVSDAFGSLTGGSTSSGNLINDASLGDQIMGGTGFGSTGSSSSNPLSTLSTLLSGVNSAMGAPPASAKTQEPAPQSDPVGSQIGSQSNVSPGPGAQPMPTVAPGETGPQSPQASRSQGDQGPLDELAKALKALQGKPTSPTGLIPQGRDITVRRPPAPPAYEPGDTGPPAPPQTPPPAPTPGSEPQTPIQFPPAAPQQAEPQHMSQLMRDLAGISTGNPMALLDLAQALYPIIGSLGIAATGKGRPGVNYAGLGEIQDLFNSGGMESGIKTPPTFDKNGNPTRGGPFDSRGAFVGSPDKTPVSNQIPGVTPKIADGYIRQSAPKFGIDPDVASKVLGAESGYAQNNINKRDVNAYPDYGPMQLNMAPGALGDQFLKETGKDPRNFAQDWKQQIDYALAHVAKEGWTDLYPGTSKKLGLDRWTGIPHYGGGGIQKPIPEYSSPPIKAGARFTLPSDPLIG